MPAMGQTVQPASPGILEVDALFPRNETYTPQAAMPIVLAVQNPSLLRPLGAIFSWDLWEGDNYSSPGSIQQGAFDVKSMDFISNNTALITEFINTISYPDGYWTLYWSLQIDTCLQHGNSSFQHFQPIYVNSSTVFTISKTGQAPNVVAATSSDTCGSASAFAFNATSFEEFEFCGWLGSTPTTNPCSATINATVASSILAEGTTTACALKNPNVTCPAYHRSSASSANLNGRFAVVTASTLVAMLVIVIHL
ncbi:hypothetical protein ZTR_03239 [Talaromyces verruculosus]|nr:hypothetical protein ZTR_03239 [Talaromyces verruculosus]